jgi:hypothetical protein
VGKNVESVDDRKKDWLENQYVNIQSNRWWSIHRDSIILRILFIDFLVFWYHRHTNDIVIVIMILQFCVTSYM